MLGGSEGSFGEELEKEIGLLLKEQRRQDDDDFERELNLYRSGSAPPTVEGSLNAVGGLFNHNGGGGGGSGGAFLGFTNNKKGNELPSEEELRSDPAYLSYYYSNVNLNPRLPPPLLSKEDWRFAQRLQGGSSALGGIGDRRKLNRNDSVRGERSMFSMPPGFSSKKGESESELEKMNSSAEWGGDGLIGLPGLGLGGKKKSIAEIFQDDLGHAPPAGIPSRPASRTAFENSESLGPAEAELAHLRSELASKDSLRASVALQSSSSFQSTGPPASYSYAAVVGASLSRSTTPDPKVIARAPSPCLPPIGGERVNASEKRSNNIPNSFNSVSATISGSTDLVTALSGMTLSNGVMDEESHLSTQPETLFSLQSSQNNTKQHTYMKKTESVGFDMPYTDSKRNNGAGLDLSNSSSILDRQTSLHRTPATPNKPYLKTSSASTLNNKGTFPSHYQPVDTVNPSLLSYGLGGYSAMPSMMAGHLGSPNRPSLYENAESQNLNRMGNHMGGNTLQAPLMDPMYLQFLTAEYALNDPSNMGNPYMDLLQKAYMGTLLSPQKAQIGVPMGTKSGVSNHNSYYGNPAFGVGLSYPGSPLTSPVIPNSPAGPGSPLRHGHANMRFPSSMRNLSGGAMGPWNLQGSYGMEDSFGLSLLEEFKSNKTKCFELLEIAGHVVEFSADQYGSRFIQQKLETATIDEKNMVFEEINPHAITLMTDVFGNYVIQKFFEHGIVSQRRELAGKLLGHVLTLSLQMYGCRVIQKAIEVVDLDQKIKMVEELDGHVMRCVRDQNGNHVIQKCIECIPEEHIQFIVSTFFDQFVSLSTHPYGCRVIQRILEHCADPQTQSKVMDEILGSVSMLAQDQYGNYVVQHVLEHGKPHERSTIIKELAGKIVQMSQQKFASNVVEKCLTFGGPDERLLLVNEMLGTTDENEPLQAMMKDQFANYVVQKVLETCDDQQRELILSRIKVHLNALKKYTYGKHIVARVEKLVAAGERRIAAQSPHPA